MTKREFLFGVGGTVAGGVVTTYGNLMVERQREGAERRKAQFEADRAAAVERSKALEALAASYDDLGDLPRRAAEFAETGKGGSPDDVRIIARHFDRVLRTIRTKALTPDEIAASYGGRIRGWGARLTALARRQTAAGRAFSIAESYHFSLEGPALTAISERAVADIGIEEIDDYGMVDNAAGAIAEEEYGNAM